MRCGLERRRVIGDDLLDDLLEEGTSGDRLHDDRDEKSEIRASELIEVTTDSAAAP